MPPDLTDEIQRFEQKYAENPDSLVFARLADLYRKSGEPDRALGVLEKGLERHPDYLSGLIVRARCLRDLDRDAEAGEAFRRVLELDDQNLVAVRSLAELALEGGDVDEAERRYDQLLELDPHNDEARSALREIRGEEPEEPAGEGAPGAEAGSEPPERGSPPGDGLPRDEPPASGTEEGDELWWKEGEDESAFAPEPEDAGAGRPEDESPPDAEDPGDAADLPAADRPAEEEAAAGSGDVFGLAEPGESDLDEADPDGRGGGRDPEPPGPFEDDEEDDDARREAEFLGLDEEDERVEEPEGGREPAGRQGATDDEEPTDAEERAEAGEPPDGELPAAEELDERVEAISGLEAGGPDAEDGQEDSEDLLTETLAGLYETQGFYREAVEMYEELLEERPGDEELQARLDAARSAMGEDEATGGPGPVDAAAAGGDSDETAGRRPEEAAPVPAGEEPATGQEPGGATVRQGPEGEPAKDDDGPERKPDDDRPRREPDPSPPEPEPEPETAREHLRALLRGRARESGAAVGESSGRGS